MTPCRTAAVDRAVGTATMFHVKPAAAAEPLDFAACVGAAVARLLERFDFVPPPSLLPRLERFAATLHRWGQRTNLTAAPTDPSAVAFHIADSLAPLILAGHPPLTAAFTRATSALDLGSGAGFPGLILAAATEGSFTLLERRRKRVSFLRVAAAAMELTNVRIASALDDLAEVGGQLRAQVSDQVNRRVGYDLAGYDLALARAFANPAEVFPIAARVIRPTGRLILYLTSAQSVPAPPPGFATAGSLSYSLPRDNGAFQGRLLIVRRRD